MTDTQQFQQNDVVVRTALEYGNVEEGGVYVVDDAPDNWNLVLLDDPTWYDQRGFELAEACDGRDVEEGDCRRPLHHDGLCTNPDTCTDYCEHDYLLIPEGRAASEQTPRLDETLSEPTVFDGDPEEDPDDAPRFRPGDQVVRTRHLGHVFNEGEVYTVTSETDFVLTLEEEEGVFQADFFEPAIPFEDEPEDGPTLGDVGPFDSDHDVLFPLGSPVTVIEGGLVDGPGAGDYAPELFIGQRLVVHAEEDFVEDNPDHIVVLNGDADPGRWAVARLSHVVPIAPAPEEEPDEEPDAVRTVEGDLTYSFALRNNRGAPCEDGIAETVQLAVQTTVREALEQHEDLDMAGSVGINGWAVQDSDWERIIDTLHVEVL